MNQQNRTFEETFPIYAFAPLVALGLELGKRFNAVMHGTSNRRHDSAASLPANGAASLR